MQEVQGRQDSKAEQDDGYVHTTGATVARMTELEGSSAQSLAATEGVQFFVAEGPYFYPLSCATAGWGALLAGVDRARVLMLAADHPPGGVSVLGEAEVRTDRSRPRHNAGVFADAKSALIEQGAGSRTPTSLRPAPTIHVPKPGIRNRIYQVVSLVLSRIFKLSQPTRVEWTIGVLPTWDITLGEEFPWSSVKWLTPPKDGIIADPFLVEADTQTWLFYERMLSNEALGTLWVAPFDGKNVKLEEEVEVLKTSFHLSFPYVFSHAGEWYMLPEQARSGATSLYRARTFPYHWDKCRDILPTFPGIDPVLHYKDGIWWLFATHGMRPCNENNLFLFYAPSLTSEFVSHPMNPIAIGLHGARMAGRLIERSGKTFRLGQDGRAEYGQALVMFEIDELTKDIYRERHVRTWMPEPQGRYPTGFHSYDESSSVVIIDGKRLVPRARRSLAEVIKLIHKRFLSKS